MSPKPCEWLLEPLSTAYTEGPDPYARQCHLLRFRRRLAASGGAAIRSRDCGLACLAMVAGFHGRLDLSTAPAAPCRSRHDDRTLLLMAQRLRHDQPRCPAQTSRSPETAHASDCSLHPGDLTRRAARRCRRHDRQHAFFAFMSYRQEFLDKTTSLIETGIKYRMLDAASGTHRRYRARRPRGHVAFRYAERTPSRRWSPGRPRDQ